MYRPPSCNSVTEQNIARYLRSSEALTPLCTHNGCIDSQTLHCDVLFEHNGWVIVAVQFMALIEAESEESVVPCFGRLELRLDSRAENVLEACVL